MTPKPEFKLPEFSEPPVIETVIGVQFAPLEALSILHYGMYWTKIRSDYPEHSVQPPLGSASESFKDEQTTPLMPPTFEIGFLKEPEIRCWFIESSKNRLIQVQKDRFIHNWRKLKDDDVYPRYDNLKPKFVEEWQRFCEFLNNEKIGIPEVNQCEVTYINHIEIGRGWKSFGEVNKVVSYWHGKSLEGFLPNPEKMDLSVDYVIPGRKGRLHIVMRPGIRKEDARDILYLELTARGSPNSSSLEGILEWFDLGHEWIVRGFTDFTTQEMHKIWGRKL